MISVKNNLLTYRQLHCRCAIGKSGFSANKREGDGCTPLGRFALRECWYRADRLPAPATRLPLRVITEDDGWCDDPAHPLYNRPVSRPFPASHERLWREDHAYDLIVPLGYNDDPPAAGKGSAIFMHVAQPDYAPTAGCIALAPHDLLALLQGVDADTVIDIRANGSD